MPITNLASRTNIAEVGDRIYRINTPVEVLGGFSFNQYLIVDDEPLLFHTGPRALFGVVSEAIASVIPIDKLRYVAFSHAEADECGSLNEFLTVAPSSVVVCSRIAAMTFAGDQAQREPRALADGETLSLGGRSVRWLDAPHVPHGWDCGFMFDESTRSLLCGDLFTQAGYGEEAVIESDVLGPSEALRRQMDYYSHGPNTRSTIERFAALQPELLACMHGSAWRGDGGALLTALADSLESDAIAAGMQ